MELLVNLLITLSILAIAFFYLNSRIKNALKSENLLREVQKEVQDLVRGLNETTSRNIDLMEDRINRLDSLLKGADKKIIQLSRETSKSQNSGDTYEHLVRPGKPIIPIEKNKPQTLELFDSPAPASGQPEAKKSTKDKVLEMDAQGFSPDLISSRLGVTMAEVELILTIHKGR